MIGVCLVLLLTNQHAGRDQFPAHLKINLMIKFVYNDGGRADAGYKGNADDCVCRSIAIITGKPYQEIYDALAHGNATQRRTKHSGANAGKKTAREKISTTRKWFADYMHSLGFVWIPTMGIGTGCKVHLTASELPHGKIIVSVSKHMAAVIDSELHDTFDSSRGGTRCVYGYYLYQP